MHISIFQTTYPAGFTDGREGEPEGERERLSGRAAHPEVALSEHTLECRRGPGTSLKHPMMTREVNHLVNPPGGSSFVLFSVHQSAPNSEAARLHTPAP